MPSKQDLANRGLRLWQESQLKLSPDRFEKKPQRAVEISETTSDIPEKTKVLS